MPVTFDSKGVWKKTKNCDIGTSFHQLKDSVTDYFYVVTVVKLGLDKGRLWEQLCERSFGPAMSGKS